jgi:hypothetical protein
MIIKHAKLHRTHAYLTSSSKETLQQFHDNPTKSLDTETRAITGGYSLYIRHFSFFANNTYNPPSSSVSSHVSILRNLSVLSSRALLILFTLFHDCWNLKMCWKNVFTTSLDITYTTCHLQGIKQTPCLC